MIHVVSLVHGYVVREQLERDDLNDGQQQFWGRRDIKHVFGDGGDFFVSLRCYRYERTLAGSNFLHDLQRSPVAQNRVGIAMVAGGNHHHGQLVIDERVRAVLQFSCRISLRMGVRDLFQLECSLAGNRVMHAASQV